MPKTAAIPRRRYRGIRDGHKLARNLLIANRSPPATAGIGTGMKLEFAMLTGIERIVKIPRRSGT
jgi:hypothetical protein